MFHFVDTSRMRDGMSRDQRKRLALKSKDFRILGDQLYKKGLERVLRRCVYPHEQEAILEEARQGISGGHFAREVIGRKVLQAGLWWPTLLGDPYWFVKQCDVCQRLGQPIGRDRMPHNLILA